MIGVYKNIQCLLSWLMFYFNVWFKLNVSVYFLKHRMNMELNYLHLFADLITLSKRVTSQNKHHISI